MSINVTIDGLDTEIDVSLVPSATEINPESYVALRGLKGDKGDDGVVGRDGTDGQDGVGITSITQNLDGTLSINLDDGTSYVTEPLKGADGYTPIKGVDYFDGTNGQDGRDGEDGYTPVKGVDYFDGVNGEDGADGVGIASVTKTGSSGLVDTYTITLTNGSVATFTVTNGIAGAKGETGETGNGIANAVLNADYTLTLTFTDGTSYTTPSIRGEKGEQGDAGEVDTAMSGSSVLPVQNRVIKAYVDSGLSTKADVSSLPTKVSDLMNDAGYITGYTETDPTVPSWAKASSKPSYTASEVGALPDTTAIPSKVSDLTNDAGYITSAGNTTYTLTKSGSTIMLKGSDGNNTSVTDSNTTYSKMTQSQATTGTSTTGYLISPKVLHDTIQDALPTVPTALSDLTNDMTVSDFQNDAGYLTSYTETGNIEFDTSASTGTTDGDLYALLTDWGWTDCIV